MFAEILSVGNEVVCGAVVDENAAWLARRLNELGLPVQRHAAVSDSVEAIRDEIRASARRVRVVVITGGLGPTRDDRTRQALAEALGRPLELDDASAEHIQAFFGNLGRAMPEANLQQAQLPGGTRALANAWGTAPGIRAEIGECWIYALPGVPREMKAMFDHHVAPELRELAGRWQVAVKILRTFGAGESAVGQALAEWMAPGRNPSVGTEAREGLVSVRIVACGSAAGEAERLVEADADRFRAVLGDLVFGEDDDTLAAVVGRRLVEQGATLATAESCTGGLLAKSVTDVSGSSRYFLRGYVTYSNESKVDLLGVPAALIESHGAVSEPVAKAMAEGCRQRAGSDYALSVTGIAGPTGGTADKPVGLVHFGLAEPTACHVHTVRFGEHLDREAIRDRTCSTALNLLRRLLLA
jgi:nicotinamide-nucleotide amidase